jgi:hypothetical protein
MTGQLILSWKSATEKLDCLKVDPGDLKHEYFKSTVLDFASECVKMDLQKVGCGGMDWNELAQDRDR